MFTSVGVRLINKLSSLVLGDMLLFCLLKHLMEQHTSNEICILFADDTQVLETIFSSLCSRYKNFYFSFLLCLHQILQPDLPYILTHRLITKKSFQIELQLSRYWNPYYGLHNENLVEKTYVLEWLQIWNLESFLPKSNRNNLDLGCSISKTKIFA